jgi:uncharacterized protein
MASPRKRNSSSHSQPTPRNAASQSTTPGLIDPRWLLKALGIVLFVALLCAWSTLSLLWYQGQWQLVLHPSRTIATTPASEGIGFTDLHFADDATGVPQLHGWLIPGASGSTLASSAPTALIFHGADGSIADALPHALILHDAGLNVLLFDYRGYGRSTGDHPTQSSMQQDAAVALNWLISTQHVPPQNIIVYGNGIGASLAVTLASQHHEIPAIILDEPDGDLTDRVVKDAHSWLIPVRLLFHETFPLAEPLQALSTPKLLITYNATQPPPALANAADPKITIEFPRPDDDDGAIVGGIRRFLDQYLRTH